MNWQYDGNAAGELLILAVTLVRIDEEVTVTWLNAYTARLDQENSSMQSLRALDLEHCQVARFSEPPCMRLVTATEDGMEEVTCRVPGVVCSKVLPPIQGPLRSTQFQHVRMLRQHVRLSGVGSITFLENEERLEEITDIFTDAVGGRGMEGITGAQYDGEFAIDAHARYLTEHRLVPGQRHIPFTPDIDPQNVLEAARDIHFIRTPDNVVEYRVRREGEMGATTLEPLNPGEIKEGDLVEAMVTFMAYPLGRETGGEDATYKLVTTLRGLTLLNTEFRERSREGVKVKTREGGSQSRQRRQPAMTAASLKRKYVPYAITGLQTVSATTGRTRE